MEPRASAFGLSPGLGSPDPLGRTRLRDSENTRPQGGIYPAWGVNPRWEMPEDLQAPKGRQVLPRERYAAVCRPCGAWGGGRRPGPGVATPGWINSALRAGFPAFLLDGS